MLGLGNVIELLKRLLVLCGGYYDFHKRAHKIVVLVMSNANNQITPQSTLN